MTRFEIDAYAPKSGRRATLVNALERLYDRRPEGAHIVEVGTTRNLSPQACASDGWATRVFAWYADGTGGRLTTIDNRTSALKTARALCGAWSDSVEFVCGDALGHIADMNGIDLLYMDGPADAEFHFRLYRALASRPPLVLFDDILDLSYRVKGETAIPAMLRDGYFLRFLRDRQALLGVP